MYRLYLQEGCVDHYQDVTLVCHACLYIQNKRILLLLQILRSAKTIIFLVVHNSKIWVTEPCIPRLNHTIFNVQKPVCVFIRYAQGGLKFFTEVAALVPSNMLRRVGRGLALTVQTQIVAQNEIQLKTVQNKDSEQEMHQNLQNNATYMYSVRNEKTMVTLLSPKSELKTSIIFQQ